MYNLRSVEFILANYWALKLGQIPMEICIKREYNNRAPYETALIWVCDLDTAIDRLDARRPGHWLRAAKVITESRLAQVVHRFNGRQQAIMRWYLLPEKQEDVHRAYRTVRLLRRLMNGNKEMK